MVNNRLSNLRQEMSRLGLDAVLVSQPQNRRYLSGFTGSAGFLLITVHDATLATDFRYTEQATIQAPDYVIFQITGAISNWLPELIADLNNERLGFEDRHVTFSFYQQLYDIIKDTRPRLELAPVEGLVEKLRAVKEPGEIEFITRASEITDKAFEQVTDTLKVGMTEREVAWMLESRLRELGSQTIAFDVIFASGLNAAMPHAKPSERRIQPGEPIVIDMGARFEGYCSDLTRTICLGKPDDTFKQVYNTVLKAQSAAISGIREGMSGHDADALARAVIEEAGHGQAFGHSLGHGVGLAEHEEPRLGPNSEDLLNANMVFSIEPGIYLTGWGGVRIEDLAVMDGNKPRLLSNAKKMDTGGLISP
ncbi:MAG TPA: aminopeptidase P family protein [Dehalococcoidia bacterium]|nr:aminopeptidase P family protein [Dehalococcoidia bacterium]